MLNFLPPGPAGSDAVSLWRRLVAGDASALDPLYRREAGPVYRFALALCGNPSWAADATQEAFVALATRPQGFDPARGSIGAYLAGVARHGVLAQWRAGPVGEAWPPSEDASEVDADGSPANPEELLVHDQGLDALWAAVRSLPWPFREALVLVDIQERSYAEAAAIAGIELNTLRTRLHRARRQLARQLAEDRP